MNLCAEVLTLMQGKTLVTAESLTGGGIGAALTAVPGSSAVYKGGVICYTDEVKHEILGVSNEILSNDGAVSLRAAEAMASGARKLLKADAAVSVTGLAGPGGDEFGHPVGTVFIGVSCGSRAFAKGFHFDGDREAVRQQTIKAALELILETYEKRSG